MNDTLKYIKNKYHLSLDVQLPIVLSPFHRCHQLVDLFRELNFRNGAEIGTGQGKYAETLCRHIPNLKLYCVDPYKTYEDYRESWANDQNAMDALFQETKNKLSTYNCAIIRKTSVEGAKDFEPNSLDFVFIDGNHDFEYVINDIISWMKIAKPGGILCGHDFYAGIAHGTTFHIPFAVKAYAAAYNINPWFVLHHRGTVDCWMWVKE